MQDKLWEAIISRPEIEENEREAVYDYLKGYLTYLPIRLRVAVGSYENVVNDFIKFKPSHTISDCLEKIKFYTQ